MNSSFYMTYGDADLCALLLLLLDTKIRSSQSYPSFLIPTFGSSTGHSWLRICVITSILFLPRCIRCISTTSFIEISSQRKSASIHLVCLLLTLVFACSNFLYNPDIREGVLVDFGLAEVYLIYDCIFFSVPPKLSCDSSVRDRSIRAPAFAFTSLKYAAIGS